MNHPYFSIIIPVYNRAELLLKSLNSLLSQTFQDYEVIIIDDGSKEDIQEKIGWLLEKHSNIRFLKRENKERGAARNLGIQLANGNYVVLFDSDDLMHSNHLQVLYSSIQKQNEPNFITTKFNFIDDKGKIYNSDICKLSPGKYDYKLFLEGNPLACNICFKNKLSNFIPFVEDRTYAIKEDWMFLMSNMKDNQLLLIDEITLTMFDHNERSMRSGNSTIISKTLKATEWIKNNISLTSKELRKLEAHKNYFCGIHSYLDEKEREAINYSLAAIKYGGLKIKYVSLLIKSVIGRKLIIKLK